MSKISARADRGPAAVGAVATEAAIAAVEIAADAVALVQVTAAANVNINQDRQLTNSRCYQREFVLSAIAFLVIKNFLIVKIITFGLLPFKESLSYTKYTNLAVNERSVTHDN